MRRHFTSHPWFLRKRQVLSQNFIARQPLTRHASRNANQEPSYHDILPSQLLRSALAGPRGPVENNGSHLEPNDLLHDILSEEWPLNTPPLPIQTWLQPQTPDWNSNLLGKALLHDVNNIRQIQQFVEGNVNGPDTAAVFQSTHFELLSRALERCQSHNSRSEILLAINGIISRIEKFDTPVSGNLHILGMQYACRCHSVSALEEHLEGYHRVSSKPLDFDTSLALVKSLVSFIDAAKFEDPEFDVSVVLDLVTGERSSHHSSQHKLHDILCWADSRGPPSSIEQYATLLAKLRSCETLQKAWSRFVEASSTEISQHAFQTVYTCVLALVNAGNVETAVSCLKQLSQHAGNRLPGISEFRKIKLLLDNETVNEVLPRLAGEKELVGIFEIELGYIEKALGIKWQPDRSVHSSISDSLCTATGQPLFTIDGDSVGFDTKDRFIAEVRSFGCSNSLTDLGRISDLLDEHDGSNIHVSLPDCRGKPIEFSWIPHRFPIDFSGTSSEANSRTDMAMPRSPPALGLIRVQILSDRDYMGSEVTLHLMQLGYLVVKPSNTLSKGPESQNKWQQSGHIVALDRATGQLLAIFIGDHHAFLEPGVNLPSFPFEFGLGLVTNITLSDCDRSNMSPGHPSVPYENLDIRLRLEADPGKDLKV